MVKKIYNYLPVIFYTNRARALDFPPARIPAPFLFFLYTAPLYIFSESLFFYPLKYQFLPSKREFSGGFSFALGLVLVRVCMCVYVYLYVYVYLHMVLINRLTASWFDVIFFRGFGIS